MKKLEFVTNAADPKHKDFRRMVVRSLGQTQEDAVQAYLAHISRHIIGRPRATKKYTVEELEKFMIGLYREVDEE